MVNPNRIASTQALVEAGAPTWAQRLALRLPEMFKLKHPLEPVEIWQGAKANLPPAANWIGCMAVVTDQNCLVVSDGTHWLKVAFGGPV
jgi:hypothetical protein